MTTPKIGRTGLAQQGSRLQGAGPRPCAGHRKSWPWRGYPCGTVAHYESGGKFYCKQHLPISAPAQADSESGQ